KPAKENDCAGKVESFGEIHLRREWICSRAPVKITWLPVKNSLRIFGVALVSLLIFIAAAFSAQAWLQRQTQDLRLAAIAGKRAAFSHLLALTPQPPEKWDRNYLRSINEALGAEVKFYRDAPPAQDDGRLSLDVADVSPGLNAHITFAVPIENRTLAVHQRALILLLLLALALFLLTAAMAAVVWLKPSAAGSPDPPLAAARSEINNLAQLAQVSVAQGTALVRERDERRRTEENLQINQKLLDHAKEEKLQLGRDLHDGIIQSLYAAGLTIQSAQSVLPANPALAGRRLDTALEALNAAIRDVRNYILGLTPERLRQLGFIQAVEMLAAELRAGRDVKFDIQLDNEAAGLLGAEQSIDALQIVREAISNSLRHGAATVVTLRLQRGEREICLLVQDNGKGFDPDARPQDGHGVNNMQARAARLGAELRISSRLGAGTRVLINIPILQTA
ncbi:MAG: sensor histidine kinase, partial [Verrucomicrobiota bacterium]|nr:sensor histidine kinase [Verrucomicrobiota bacterium]